LIADLPNPAIPAPVVDAPEVDITNIKLSEPPSYTKGQKLATREAYGSALVRLLLTFV
jgi:transketolase